jgi:hypothetical protein
MKTALHARRSPPAAGAAILLACLVALPVQAQPPAAQQPSQAKPPSRAHDPAATMAAQRQALTRLAFLDGTWRGPARHTTPDGKVHALVQTERVGPMLDGTVRVIEGRGYGADGGTVFNAFAVLSWDPALQAYGMRSYAMGHAGDYAFRPTEDGFVWEIPAGPATIRYTATIANGTWHEVGERIVADKPPQAFFEMTLQRIGDSDWPAAGTVPMR